ncbi:two-component system, NtrC family, C4-dicarboxylate transport sensor histidine kinase DctB [Sphingomonas sp. NFR04]|uniref:sensor histidine kinase n=1 Tax=Sphingomonas sp. NFR04 TaxID=1566283 RepID=UPI0008E647FF|nr:ATP-binding protein [Sphingomonas sp. NFR04]SFK50079.1 two-component system, NtrC family, C4-dicarboxylate transport sensor histidine kinase DctB [Sphingomonas sp. NFR04]
MTRRDSFSGWRYWALAALLGVAVAVAAGWIAGSRTRETLVSGARTNAQLRAALLDSEISRFRLLPLALGDDRDVAATLAGAPPRALNAKLESLARTTGAAAIYVIGADGRTRAASNWRTPQSFVGSDYRFRRYFREASSRGEASQFALGTVSRHSGLYLARRTPLNGVIVVKLEFDAIEAAWRQAGGDTYVEDPAGLVLVASDPGLRFAVARPILPAVLASLRREAALPESSAPVLLPPARGDLIEARVPTSQPGWTLALRRSVGPAVAAAQRTAGLGALMAVLALALLLWGLRQRATQRQRRTSELETAVAERTAELRREIEERAALEARAADLREGLRQANRLATLGQVTASVAHETAQPVAAIRTYAETSVQLLAQGATEMVRDNLETIRRLSDRIGAVTAQLRGFSRRQPGEIRALPLAEVLDGALLILKEQLRNVRLERPAIGAQLLVMGGRVRLEQVFVNLLQNAAEALAGRPEPTITIRVTLSDGLVWVRIQDNGPGIAPDIAARLFTPFATSRSNGLGLGLVIASDIMTDLGGSLRWLPDEGGACFELELRHA